MPGKWTPEEDAQLKALWSAGLSGNQVALRLNRTRNSVLGRVDRLDLPPRNPTSNARVYRKPASPAPVERSPGVSVPPPQPDDIPTKTFDQLEPYDGCCRWRIDKEFRGQPYGFCGKRTVVGLSVCEQHASRSFSNWPEMASRYVKRAKEAETV